jgi:glycine/sarcosine N-methyltransferase
MDHRWILPVPEFYARYNFNVEAFAREQQEEIEDRAFWTSLLREVLGEAGGRSVLDCSCGWGTQAVPLAKLGWQVTACDVSESSMDDARKYASEAGVSVDFRVCDMRDLARVFNQHFDWVVSCYALYEIPTDEGIHQAIHGMFSALKPGGKCFLLFRDMDFLMEEQPRHVFHGERQIPNGRIIWIQDWDYESESTVIALDAFLREDKCRAPSDHFRWVTETIGVRKKVLRKAELQRMLLSEGFDPVIFLPQPEPWMDVQLVATRPEQRITNE